MKTIILAGGKGTRLWPISRHAFPKQFLHFGDRYSLLQKTIFRFLKRCQKEDLFIVTSQQYYHLVKSQCQEIDPSHEWSILIEPEPKNTAPAIALALKYLQEKGISEHENILISSSDCFISPEDSFLEAVAQGEKESAAGFLVLFGVFPHRPETGYGYIQVQPKQSEGSLDVLRFVEKPDFGLAEQYVLSGEYLWNSGIFMFTMATFWKELETYFPVLEKACDHSFQTLLNSFADFPDISIDYALLEKSKQVKVMPMNLTWSDVGSWDSVYETFEKDKNLNVKIGNIVDIDTKNCLIVGDKRLISAVGLEDTIVIETEDAVFIGKKGESQKVKQLVEELNKRKAKESLEHLTSYRPWGQYTVLEEGERYKIKKITVSPKKRLSFQMHYHRSEHWIVVKGTAKVVIEHQEKLLHENESIFVPKSTRHRLENPGKVPLEIIEVQSGEYIGEDDIVRFEDDYARL
jgi:mannose-1-phosphate guanylyltransferase / mannose-6-phosphate isomerase